MIASPDDIFSSGRHCVFYAFFPKGKFFRLGETALTGTESHSPICPKSSRRLFVPRSFNPAKFPMRFPRLSRLSRAAQLLFIATTSFSFAIADETSSQRQLREDRERFRREADRQAIDAKIRADQARMAAEQQRTAEELERLRVQQERQTAENRRFENDVRARETAPALGTVPPATSVASPAVVYTPASVSVTPDFSVTLLADGNCVLYVKGRPPEIKSSAEALAAFQQLLAGKTETSPR